MFCFVLKKKIMTKLHSSFSGSTMTSVPCGVRQICSARKQSNIFLLLHNMTVFCFIIQVKQGF